MDERTAKALEASIKHWQENVAAMEPDGATPYSDHCALCGLFDAYADCEGCPVSARTEEGNCEGSPWVEAYEAYRVWQLSPSDRSRYERFHAAAQKEVDFLISLRTAK